MTKRIEDYLAIDLSSPSGLRWKQSPAASVPAGRCAFTNLVSGYYQGGFSGEYYKAHRVVYFLSTGHWPAGDVDHIDGDRLNNAPSNLRDVTKSVNSQNQKKAKGYWYDKRCGKYLARIRIPGEKRQRYLGLFETKEQAINAYQAAKRQLHPGYVPESKP